MDTFSLRLILMLSYISLTSTAIVKWLPSASLNLPHNYRDEKLPCSKKTVVFPESLDGALDLQTAMDVAGLVLPDDGEIVLENAMIALGEDLAESNCTKGYSYFWNNVASSWNQAGVWSSSRFTAATPDTERLPCFDDTVVFPDKGEYSVTLPDFTQTVRGLMIGNQSYGTQEFRSRINGQTNEMQQFVYNTDMEVGVSVQSVNCKYKFGCPCQLNTLKIDCGAKFCPIPTCDYPIKPEGYCCSFCGGHLTFVVDQSFVMESFKNFVIHILDGYGDTLMYHISVLTITPEPKVQLVVIEKGEYSGTSAVAINSIDHELYSHWYKGNNKLAQVSGIPFNKRGTGIKIFVSVFFAVGCFMGAVYLYYYRIPSVRLPLLGDLGIFSRIQNRSDSVVSLTRRDSTVLPSRTAFRNPLYDSRRGRVVVEETAVEE